MKGVKTVPSTIAVPLDFGCEARGRGYDSLRRIATLSQESSSYGKKPYSAPLPYDLDLTKGLPSHKLTHATNFTGELLNIGSYYDAIKQSVMSWALTAAMAQAMGDSTRIIYAHIDIDHLSNIAGLFGTSPDPEWINWSSKLEQFESLVDGWDSYNARRPSSESIGAAKVFLEYLQKHNNPPTKLTPSVVGGIGFTFRNGPRSVYVEFRNTGNTHAALIDDNDDSEDFAVLKVIINEMGFKALMERTIRFLHEQTSRRVEGGNEG